MNVPRHEIAPEAMMDALGDTAPLSPGEQMPDPKEKISQDTRNRIGKLAADIEFNQVD